MSVIIMGKVFELDLGTRDKFVLLALSDHADHDGSNCYPSIERIAQKTGYSRRTVQKSFRSLQEQGLITPTGNQEGGRGLSAVYRINIEKGELNAWFSQKGEADDEKGESLTQKGEADDEKGELGSPQPSRTNKDNHKETKDETRQVAEDIFDYWQDLSETMTHRTNKQGHVSAIEARLEDGFEPGELCDAVERLNSLYAGEYPTWLDTRWTCKEFFSTKQGAHVERMLDHFEHFLNEDELTEAQKKWKEAVDGS